VSWSSTAPSRTAPPASCAMCRSFMPWAGGTGQASRTGYALPTNGIWTLKS